jgi:hypothetical protein
MSCISYISLQDSLVLTIDINEVTMHKKRINMILRNNSNEIYEVESSYYTVPSYHLSFYYIDNSGNKILLEKCIYASIHRKRIEPLLIDPRVQLYNYQDFSLKEGEFTDYGSYKKYTGKIIYLEYEGYFLPIPDDVTEIFITCKVNVGGFEVKSNIITLKIEV